MRLGYVTTDDPADPGVWSGSVAGMAGSLRGAGVDLVPVGPLPRRVTARILAGELANRLRGRRHFHREREGSVARFHGRSAGRRLRQADATAALSPGTLPVADLDFDGPLAVWTDATFALLIDSYAEYSGLARRTLREGHDLERRALARADALIYTSEWAAASAVADYGADPARVHVVPFGANMPVPDPETARTDIAARASGDLTVVFIGADWPRKRGDFAIETVGRMRALGADARLIMFGARPPRGAPLPDFVEVRGFADKRTGGAAAITDVLRRGHLLLMPSAADCTPVAISEAAAHGVPCLASDVGGMASVVADGRTGRLLPPGAGPDEYAEAALGLTADPGGYAVVARAARSEYESRLSWDVGGRRVAEIIAGLAAT